VVLAVELAQLSKVADHRSLGLFRAVERDLRLGGHRCRYRRLRRRDENEPVALGLPGKVDDRILDRGHHLQRHTFFLEAENLQRCLEKLLVAVVAVNLDAQVRRLRLPVKLGIRHIENRLHTNNFLGRDAHDREFGRIAAAVGRPVA